MFSIPPISLAILLKLVFIVFAACVPLVLFVRGKLLHRVRLSRQIPGPSLWELATVHAKHLMSSDSLTYLRKLTTQYDFKPWCFWKGLDLLVVISDADTIEAAFKSKNLANKTEAFYEGVSDVIGECSIMLNGPKGKLRRTLMNPAFNKAFLDANLDVMYEEAVACAQKIMALAGKTDASIEKLVQGGLLRVSLRSIASRHHKLSEETLQVISWSITHGAELVQRKYANFFQFCFEQTFNRTERELTAKMLRLLDDMREIVRNGLAIFRNGPTQETEESPRITTLMDYLCDEMVKKNFLTDSEIISEAVFLIAASVETTSSAQLATLYMLALHPDIQTRVAEEIRHIFGQSDRPITPDDLSRMEYLERVIKESIRLFSPGALIMRHADGDTNLRGTVIPDGSSVVFNFSSLHRNPKFFEEPMKFDPDRFSPESQTERHPFAYMPFSHGARNCVGRLHAMIMMKTITTTFLRRFKILPGRGMNGIEDIQTELAFTMHVKGNHNVQIVPL